MATHVLVPVDESSQSTKALEFALEEHPDATITAVNVVDPREFYGGLGIEGSAVTEYERLRESHENLSNELLEDARTAAEGAGREIETDRLFGSVPQRIIDYAGEHDVDHVVIGSHGRTGASRILLGSVAETVVRRSPVPVTVVR